MPKTYIVIVNYNGHTDTPECLETVLKQDFEDFQVLIVDNSTNADSLNRLLVWADGKETAIATEFENLVYPLVAKPVQYSVISENELLLKERTEKGLFIKANENKGFAAANNVALRYIQKYGSSEDYVWLLNNDTVIEKDCLSQILTGLKKHNEPATIFGTPLLEYYQKGTVQVVGGLYNRITGTTTHVGEGIPVPVLEEEITDKIDYPVGASIIVKKDFLDIVGLMNEEYFLYFEEPDWTARAKMAGGDCVILPVYGVYHKQGGSTVKTKVKSKPEFIDLLSLRNRIIFAKRYNAKNVVFIYLFIMGITIPRRILAGNFKIVPGIIKMLFKQLNTKSGAL